MSTPSNIFPELTVHESQMLSLRLNVLGWAELAPLFESVRGTLLNDRFQIGRLITASRNSFLLTGMDHAENEVVVIKVPALNYLRPILYSEVDIASKRGDLRKEFAILRACQTGHLPKPIAFFEADLSICTLFANAN